MHHAVHLVNRLTPGWRSGREIPVVVAPDERRLLVQRVFGDSDMKLGDVDADEIERFWRLAAQLRPVFELAEVDDVDGAASYVNQLLKDYLPHPELSGHDGQPWHLHFHSEDEGASGWGAGCATGLAIVIGDGDADRLGICTASHCDRVFVDSSRNCSRRFCGEACMNRTKVSAFRARKTLARRTDGDPVDPPSS